MSPAWPLDYADFEPWYTKAEWLYQVHGNAGEDPTEGKRSKDYPWPAVSHEPRLQQLHDDLAAGGYRPFHAPCGILLDEAEQTVSFDGVGERPLLSINRFRYRRAASYPPAYPFPFNSRYRSALLRFPAATQSAMNAANGSTAVALARPGCQSGHVSSRR